MDDAETFLLLTDLRLMNDRLEEQIVIISDTAFNQNISPYELRLPDGRWALADLLCAKASVLATLVTLKGEE